MNNHKILNVQKGTGTVCLLWTFLSGDTIERTIAQQQYSGFLLPSISQIKKVTSGEKEEGTGVRNGNKGEGRERQRWKTRGDLATEEQGRMSKILVNPTSSSWKELPKFRQWVYKHTGIHVSDSQCRKNFSRVFWMEHVMG